MVAIHPGGCVLSYLLYFIIFQYFIEATCIFIGMYEASNNPVTDLPVHDLILLKLRSTVDLLVEFAKDCSRL